MSTTKTLNKWLEKRIAKLEKQYKFSERVMNDLPYGRQRNQQKRRVASIRWCLHYLRAHEPTRESIQEELQLHESRLKRQEKIFDSWDKLEPNASARKIQLMRQAIGIHDTILIIQNLKRILD